MMNGTKYMNLLRLVDQRDLGVTNCHAYLLLMSVQMLVSEWASTVG